jgi:hypothetical protein
LRESGVADLFSRALPASQAIIAKNQATRVILPEVNENPGKANLSQIS